MKHWKCWALLLALGSLVGSAQAALVNRGGGLIYDSTLNVTWLADANYVKTTGVDSDGRISLSDASAWADALAYASYSDWRLPTIGELQNLFRVDFGNTWPTGVFDSTGDTADQLANLALFLNVQEGLYWSSSTDTGHALLWSASTGGMALFLSGVEEGLVMAVRPGDVGAELPEPSSGALVALAAAAALWRRRPAR